MERVKNVWDEFCSEDLLKQAIKNAAKGKLKYAHVRRTLLKIDKYTKKLSQNLKEGKFDPALYERKLIKTYGKEREIFKLPFYPDRCIQHAIAIVMLKRWSKSLTDDTYASWAERGINSKNLKWNLNYKLRKAICSYPFSKDIYALQLDIKKCYPSINNEILKKRNLVYCGDEKLIELFYKIIDKTQGLPIGNYISQLWVNIYLSPLDRFIREEIKVDYYFRYMDDIIILSDNKEYLHQVQWRIINFCWYELKVEINHKRQIYKVGRNKSERGIDFVGYVYKRNYTLVRKRTKQAFKDKKDKPKSVVSYLGILKYCDSKNLVKTVLNDSNMAKSLKDLKINKVERPFEGDKIKIEVLVDKPITILDFDIQDSSKKEGTKYLKMQIKYEGKKRFLGGGFQFLCEVLSQIDKRDLPLDTVIKYKRGYYFEGTLEED